MASTNNIFHVHYCHSLQIITKKDFLRDVVSTYVRTVKGRYAAPIDEERKLVPMEMNGHYPVPAKKQGRCKVCKANTTKACAACNVNLHTDKGCFALYHPKL